MIVSWPPQFGQRAQLGIRCQNTMEPNEVQPRPGHQRSQLGLCCQQQAQRDGQRQHPLAHRHVGDHTVDQVSSRLRHAPGTARRAKAAPLAAERDEFVVAAVAAAQSQETVGQDAAFEEGVELVFDELRQVGAGSVFGLGEEGRGVLLHQTC